MCVCAHPTLQINGPQHNKKNKNFFVVVFTTSYVAIREGVPHFFITGP